MSAHWIVTPLFFVWLYRRRRHAYAYVRNAFLAANAVALVVFMLFPVAPPRLAGTREGLVDTLHAVSGVDLHGGMLSGWFNPNAAVPSMHFGYAFLIGVVGVALVRNPVARIALAAYPAIVLLTIVGTANHYVLDAAAGGAVMLLGLGGRRGVAGAGGPGASAQHVPQPEARGARRRRQDRPLAVAGLHRRPDAPLPPAVRTGHPLRGGRLRRGGRAGRRGHRTAPSGLRTQKSLTASGAARVPAARGTARRATRSSGRRGGPGAAGARSRVPVGYAERTFRSRVPATSKTWTL